MTRNTTTIPKAPMGRIIQDAGAKRVADDAMAVFSEILTEAADDIAQRAVEIAKHSGRKTVHDGDVKLAFKQRN